jgi:hypothetical protein
LRCADPQHAEAATSLLDQIAKGQLVERDGQPPARWLLYRQLVVAAAKVLHQRMPGDDHPGTTVLFEAAHWSQSSLQPAMVALDPVVGVLISAVPCRWQQRLQHPWVDRCLIGCDLGRA